MWQAMPMGRRTWATLAADMERHRLEQGWRLTPGRDWALRSRHRLTAKMSAHKPTVGPIPPSLYVDPRAIVTICGDALITSGRDSHVGAFTILDLSTDLHGPEDPSRLLIGHRVSINEHNNIRAGGCTIEIGDDTLVSQMVSIIGRNHSTARGQSIRSQRWAVGGGVIVGRDVWLCAGAVLLPGADVGDGAIVAAGAVVRGFVPPYSIVAGVPARVVGERS